MAGYPRVTHPSATKFKITRFHLNFVRLACVKHAASVHPEPGSNSHVEICSCQNIWLFPFLKLFVQAFGITVFRLFLNFSFNWNFQGCIIVYLSRFCTAFLCGNFDRISQPQFIVNTFLKSFLKFFVEIRTI